MYPPPLSAPAQAWRQLRALPALCRASYPEDRSRYRYKRPWLMARVLWHFRSHLQLMALLEQPDFAPQLAAQPQLLRKLQLSYPFHGLAHPQRVAWFLGHCRATRQLLGPALARQVLAGEQPVACRVNLPDGHGQLPVLLRPAHRKHLREGDLTLELLDPFGTKLYALTFTLQPIESGHELLIGALQGQMPRELMRHITKLSLGLRPPNLMLCVLQAIAHGIGVQRLRACGRERHIHRGGKREALVQFDYDGFWQSIGGRADGQGFFELPLQPGRREPADIPSHKRSQYRRRYAWLDELQADVRRWLAEQQVPGALA